ncbi:calcium-binding protein, partial [Ideonella azotifigens]
IDGGAGNDTFVFARGDGADTASDYDTTAGNVDLLSFGANIATDQLWFRKVGTNLEVSVIGTSDKVSITSWYSSTSYHIEQFQTANGAVLLDSQVNALVDAMAAFSPPAAGQTTLPPDYQSSLTPVIAANWH